MASVDQTRTWPSSPVQQGVEKSRALIALTYLRRRWPASSHRARCGSYRPRNLSALLRRTNGISIRRDKEIRCMLRGGQLTTMAQPRRLDNIHVVWEAPMDAARSCRCQGVLVELGKSQEALGQVEIRDPWIARGGRDKGVPCATLL